MAKEISAEQEKNFGLIRPGGIPTATIFWPTQQHNADQIQQTKGSASPQVTFNLPTTLPGQPIVAPRTTPSNVSKVRVVSRPSTGGRQITVQFNHPANPKYFAGANVYLKKSGQEPVLVASGAKSPLTFTANEDESPHSIYVTSVGNWGETNITQSPSVPVRLSNASVK